MSGGSPLHQWARVLVDSLVQAGIGHAVICPGSRSTPFAWAALHHSGLLCTSLIDERSAAYFALGQARIVGRPSVVITTSGTAAANCLPAVVESRMSATPLLVLTADRPPELQECRAPQTIDQIKLFGDQPRHFVDLGMPESTTLALRALGRKATQAVLRCSWPLPGPVHLNAPARKPLEPAAESGDTPGQSDPSDPARHLPPTTVHVPEARVTQSTLEALVNACRGSRRGLLVCGPDNPAESSNAAAVSVVVRHSGMVVLCEAASQLRFALPPGLREHVFDGYDLALRIPEFRAHAVPDFVLQLGQPPLSSSLAEYFAQHDSVERIVVAPYSWPDPTGTGSTLVQANPQHVLRSLAAALTAAPPPAAQLEAQRRQWLELHRAANAAVWDAVEHCLRPTPGRFTEAQAVRETVDALPRSALLVLGNSLPTREVETYCRARVGDARVFAQRGANGIDGILSAAAGAAQVSARPTTVLLGDVSFLHDLGGLWAARDLAQPFVVVVLNNNGGRIFEQLPVATAPGLRSAELGYWTTPHGLRLARAGDLFGYPAEAVNTAEQLQSALTQAHAHPGCTLVEVRLQPHDARDQIHQARDQAEQRLVAILETGGAGAER